MNPNLQNLINNKNIDALTQKTLKPTKRKKWRDYRKILNKNTPIRKVWQNINKFKNRRLGNEAVILMVDQWVEQFHLKLNPPYISKPFYTERQNNFNLIS